MAINQLLCRLCAHDCEKYVNIYNESEDSNMELDTKISTCLQIWVSKEDILPKTVCQTCFVKLENSFEFFQQSNKAQLLLEEICNLLRTNESNKNGHVDNGEEFQDVMQKTKTNVSDENRDIDNGDEFQDILAGTRTNENNESQDVDNSEGFQDILQYHQAEINENGESEIEKEEIQVQENSVSEPSQLYSQSDSADIRLEIPFEHNTKLSSPFGVDEDDCDEETNSIKTSQEKSRRRKKDPNINDVPANPRLSQILEGYPWSCTICEDRVLKSLQTLRDHYKEEHQQAPVFKCVSCEKQYDRYRSFSRHIKLHRNPKKYSCDICGKSFGQKTTLQAHATVHTTERPHVCETCGKSFKNFSSLYVHGRMHLPDQAKEKYRCDVCQKEFSTRHTLETHRKIHTGERDFICDICGKSFIAKGTLDYHLLSHTGDKNHVCSTCGKGFKTARLLGKHTSLHTGVKPYQCDVCGKQFRERGALREHTRIHTGAMPYRCEFCGKSFRFKGILTVHRRQHTGERPYSCLECRRYFTNWANYNKHMKRIHHCDTSNPTNSRLRSHANNVPLDAEDTELSKSVIADNKTNQYSMYVPSNEPLVNANS